MENIFQALNEKQKEAAEHKNGPLLIVAGAGVGKTKYFENFIKFVNFAKLYKVC